MSSRRTATVDAPPSTADPAVIRFRLVSDSIVIPGEMLIDFDYRLQTAGSDLRIYANDRHPRYRVGVGTNSDMRPVTQEILQRLFGDRTGVDNVAVKPFQLRIMRSSVVPADTIMHLIHEGIVAAGWMPEKLD